MKWMRHSSLRLNMDFERHLKRTHSVKKLDIEDIKWSSTPFDCLTIPDEQKEIIIALAETRLDLVPSVPFDDFVTGKGRGLNVLLQ